MANAHVAWSIFDAGQRDAALIYLVSLLDEFVQDAAVRRRVRDRDRSTPAVIHELSFIGAIGEPTADVLEGAWKWRNAMVHGHGHKEKPGRDAIDQLVRACREVQAAMKLEAA